MVGSCVFSDNTFFTDSMILDNSPPEATFFNSPKLPPLFAEKRNSRWSLPLLK